MRLIDADALIELFEEKKQKCDNLQQLVEMTGMQAIIDAQPTAYDTEKVVEQIESLNACKLYPITFNYIFQIVRKGGAE